jgi:anti-anti-sigma factor
VTRGEAGDPDDVVRAFEAMPAVLWAFAGPEHTVVAANFAARASIGHRDDIIGRPIREVIPEMVGQQVFEMIDEVYASGRPVSHTDRRVLMDRDGDGRLEEGFFTYTFLPTGGADGAVSGMVVHIVETTDGVRQRRAVEARADESERRYREARDVVLSLQRSLLPAGVPVLPRVRLAAHYLVSGSEAAAGGDWLDAVPLPDGRVALLVGDVVGHGPDAAAVMGQLRAVALQGLSSGAGTTEALARLDDLAARLPAATASTVCLVVLDVRSGEVEVASRAHPPPLVAGGDEAPRYLDVVPGSPLGTDGKPAVVARDRLRAGQLLLLWTDGLLERPGVGQADAMAELVRVAGAVLSEPVGPDTSVPALPADRLCTLVLERFAWSGYRDDVTVLAAELLPAGRPGLRLSVPGEPHQLSVVRRALRGWLITLDLAGHDVLAVLHAVGEACGNAVEHAYAGHDAGPIRVAGDLDDHGVLHLSVTDEGRWRPAAAPGDRGRGLMMMRTLLGTVEVSSGPSGTIVAMTHRPLRPVRVGASSNVGPVAGLAAAPDPDDVFTTRLERGDRTVLRVRGAVDLETVDRLERAVMEAGRGGGSAVLDLSGVTYLSSAGVRLLHRLRAMDGAAPVLLAPEGGVPYQVLRLSGLADLIGS